VRSRLAACEVEVSEPAGVSDGLDPAAADALSPVEAVFGGRMARDTVVVTACTLLSRITGFVRVLVAAAVLSNGPLGDTYHAANMIPNLLFELVAGGVLQAVLVPTFVAARRTENDEGLGRVTGVVAGTMVVVLAGIAAVVMLLSPFIAWALTALEDDAVLVADKRSLITPMLLVFIPQIVFYGVGTVTTAALAARGRFAAAALAPAVNNVVVIACYLGFRAARDGEPASLDLDGLQFALLVGGTTLAVIAFTAVPGMVLSLQGVRWRLHWAPGDPIVASLRSTIGWAMLSVVGTLVPMGAAMVLGSGAPGGVAVFTIAFTFFVLPHALIAVPTATALAPRVADAWQRGRGHDAAVMVERSVSVVLPLLALATAALVALAFPIARVVASIGQAGSQGDAPIAHAVAAFGLGLMGYGIAVVMIRVMFGLDEVRRAARLVIVSAVIGVLVMAIASAVFAEADRAAALALGYGSAQTVSAVLLTHRVRTVIGAPRWEANGRLAISSGVAAAVAGGVMSSVQRSFSTDRAGSLAAIVVAGIAGALAFAAVLLPTAGLRPGSVWRRGGRVH
jgi:putative peptidoglycan lipid II flippase